MTGPVTGPARRRRTYGPRPRCTYEKMPAEHVEIADQMANGGIGSSPIGGPGTWYWKFCASETGLSPRTSLWAPARPEPQAAARRALHELRYTALIDPAIGMSPPPGRGAIVNIPTWLWVNAAAWGPTAATARVDGFAVTTTATPDRVVWNLGNGDELVCEGPGIPYDPSLPEAEQHSDCTYTFPTAGVFTVTASMEWHVTWAAVGAAGGGDLGVVRRSASTTVPVSEIQALNRAAR